MGILAEYAGSEPSCVCVYACVRACALTQARHERVCEVCVCARARAGFSVRACVFARARVRACARARVAGGGPPPPGPQRPSPPRPWAAVVCMRMGYVCVCVKEGDDVPRTPSRAASRMATRTASRAASPAVSLVSRTAAGAERAAAARRACGLVLSISFSASSPAAPQERRLLAAGRPVPARSRRRRPNKGAPSRPRIAAQRRRIGRRPGIQGRAPRAGPRWWAATAAHRRSGAAEP